MNTGLLLLRLVLGLLIAAHGSQKLFGCFGGHGLAAVSGMFESLGFSPGRFFASAAALSEVAGGLLLALGFLRPVRHPLLLRAILRPQLRVPSRAGVLARPAGRHSAPRCAT